MGEAKFWPTAATGWTNRVGTFVLISNMDTNQEIAAAVAAAPPETCSPLDFCQAMMLGLGLRRYVIVRRDAPIPLRSLFPLRQRVRDLQPGDEVLYKGQRVVVRSVEIYE